MEDLSDSPSQAKGFGPEKGTVARAIVTCLVCGSVVDNKTTPRLFREKKSGQRMDISWIVS